MYILDYNTSIYFLKADKNKLQMITKLVVFYLKDILISKVKTLQIILHFYKVINRISDINVYNICLIFNIWLHELLHIQHIINMNYNI